MATLPLRDGGVALVDDVDVQAYELTSYVWRRDSYGYARAPRHHRWVYLHQLLCPAPPQHGVDHIDGDRLNNRRSNLRVATQAENQRNRAKVAGFTSRFKGVCRVVRGARWRAQIYVDGRQIYLGSFEDEIDAARAYDAAALEHFGEYARLNFPAEAAA